ncbi:hypothetical protein MCOR25_004996 [Pyricularia grisea]|nr:hypothetical protein MCOR25_004996 [Pyricularia grisea]
MIVSNFMNFINFIPRTRDVDSAFFNYRLQLPPHRSIPSIDAGAPRCQGSLGSVSRFSNSQGPFLALAPWLSSFLSCLFDFSRFVDPTLGKSLDPRTLAKIVILKTLEKAGTKKTNSG